MGVSVKASDRNEINVNENKVDIVDTRFRTVLGAEAWSELPTQVQKRFSHRLAPGEVKLYDGRVEETNLSLLGWWLAQVLRPIGAPLPLYKGAKGPSVVSVIEDPEVGGQIWTRMYKSTKRFPQVVHSAKRFSGPTGLEEYVGAGIAMALTLSVVGGALVFRSEKYFIGFGQHRVRLPGWLTPGAMEIVHTQLENDQFSFELTLHHKVFGRLLYQRAVYRDVV